MAWCCSIVSISRPRSGSPRSRAHLSLSSSYELKLRLRWAAILHGHIKADMALTGGVHTAEDAIKSMMVGARAAQLPRCCSTTACNPQRHPRRYAALDGDARVRIDQADAGQHEPTKGRQSGGLRAREYMKVLQSYQVKVV